MLSAAGCIIMLREAAVIVSVAVYVAVGIMSHLSLRRAVLYRRSGILNGSRLIGAYVRIDLLRLSCRIRALPTVTLRILISRRSLSFLPGLCGLFGPHLRLLLRADFDTLIGADLGIRFGCGLDGLFCLCFK